MPGASFCLPAAADIDLGAACSATNEWEEAGASGMVLSGSEARSAVLPGYF